MSLRDFFDEARSLFLARWLKRPQEPVKPPGRRPDPMPDPPVFRDKYRERIDPEFDRTIRGMVEEIRNDPDCRAGRPIR
jgi:hypothetical protein